MTTQLEKWKPGLLTKWEPFRDLNQELGEFNNRMMNIFGMGGNGGNWPLMGESSSFADWIPAVDVAEDDNEYTIKADLPDIPKNEVKVTTDDGQLTIQGERKQEKEEKKKTFHRVERSYGRYVRSFRIPEDVEADKIDAQFKEGVLTLHLPKSEEKKQKQHQIKVH